ncbi:MAG: filamentous hemagglutinin N-terminal domain-containing protein, partial [Nitrospiraceae bacterium]|nr:filamentous hemagglutinin N-terminal domain-containing protein [Nitrospiraceae bacterium]
MKRPCRVHGVISKSKSKLFQTAATALAISFCVHFAGLLDAADIPAPSALPSGGHITAGQGSVSASGSNMRITQQSDKMIINWQSFNIGRDASVNFVQPGSTSTALNRVVGSDPSAIFGSLTANGRVFLINPSGIIFGSTARIDVGGMVASTLNMKDNDFLAGSYNFYKDGTAGSILNQGIISAKEAGFIAMLAPEIRNEGIVTADFGTVAFGAGEKMTLNFSGNNLLGITVEEGSLNALIENKNLIQSDAGRVIMTARAANELALSAVNNEGIVRARSIQEKNGVIVLDSGQSGMTTITGTLDASSTDSKGGRIVATGERVLVKSGAHLTASGALGGGEVLVGGSWQNSDTTVRQATGTVIEHGALLEANATDTGNGGTVVAWSDITNPNSVTRAYGTFEAKGGPNGGNGGRIETSGHWLDTTGSTGSAAAYSGRPGVWLFDPYDVTITTANANGSWGSAGGTDTWTPSGTSTILNTDINSKLENGTNVTITTGSPASSGLGDITVSSAITKTTGNADVTLTLQAANSILVNQAISNTGGTGKLHIVLDADNNNGIGDGAGIVMLNADITTNGGNLSFGTGRTATISGVSTLVGGDVYVAGAGARTLSTNGGNVDVKGEMIIANTSGLTINSNNGNVRFYGLLNSGNGYTYVDGPDGQANSWDWARTDAKNGTGGGSAVNDSYMVTILSRLENSVAVATAGYRGAWIGAYRPTYSSGAWVWADGPESGQQFFTQTTNGSGGTTTSGYYSNFGSGEPNGCFTSGACESRGQFFGTGGQWNDLIDTTAFSATQTSQYAVLGYVRETNIAASPLTINAGSGTVTFSGAVGSSKALASLNVTSTNSIAINGGAVTTEGLQTYAGNVTLNSAATTLTQTNANTDFTLQAAKSITNAYGADASLTIKTTGSIIMDTGSSITISSSTSKLSTVLWSDSDANGGGVYLKNNTTINTNGGHLWMGGGSGSATWNGLTVGNGYALGDSSMSNGILLDAVNISTSGGNMAYYGKSRAGAAAGGESGGLNSDGIRLGYSGNSSINSGTGTILFDGVAQGTDQNSIGFESCSVGSANNHTITSAALSGDAITIKGAGSLGASTQDWGIYLHTGTSITATGGGNIVFEGTSGGSQVATYINTSATANSNNGNLTITGDTLYVGGTLSGAGTLTVQPKTAGTTIGIAGGAGTGTLSLPASYFSTNFTNGFSGITIGNATAGAITVGGATTFNDSATLRNNSTIAVNGAITANENLTLTGNGAITQSAALAVTGTTSITAGAANNV